MSAPAALAMSKLFYPETKKSKTTTKEVAKMGETVYLIRLNISINTYWNAFALS